MKQLLLKWVWILPFLMLAKGPCKSIPHVFDQEHRDKTPFPSATITDGKLYLDVPVTVLDRALLWTRVGRGNVYDSRQIIFRKDGQRIYMEEHRIWSETGVWIPLKAAPNLDKHILGAFTILKENGKGFRIEVTDAFLEEGVVWEHRSSAALVPELSRIQEVKSKENELMVKVLLGLDKEGVRWEQPVFHSFYELPNPMKPRPFDHRMGYWIEDKDNGLDPTRQLRGSIVRWRLEKKDNDQKTSAVAKPIAFLISPEVPKKWRPYVRAGIEEWLPAFESAGFKNAIRVQEMDSLDEWSNHSLRNSVVRWGNDQAVRRKGPKRSGSTVSLVIDQRSGEIIKSNILFASTLEHLMDEYFIRCAALDDRALVYPFPDELVGELIQSIIAHETGHALGIRDSHFGEFSYPLERMGDIPWLETMGHTPSIMSYARHNNIAQPEDGVPPSLLIQKVGPLDYYNIQWGYKEFSKGMSASEKTSQLEQMIRIQDSIPWYRYNSSQYEIIGPAATNEIVETNDPVRAMPLGLENLKRALDLLPEICRDEPDGTRLKRIYGKALELWHNSMRHVLSLIGGYNIQYRSMDQVGDMFTPIPKETQERALAYLMKEAFEAPTWLTQPSFMDQIGYSSYPDDVLTVQQLLLIEMLRPQRMKRFEHMEQSKGYQGMLNWYLEQLQESLFQELMFGSGKVERRKQEVQLLYIDLLKSAISQKRQFLLANKKMQVHTDYTRGIMMQTLHRLQREVEKEVKRNKSIGSLGHWQFCLAKLKSPMGF